MKWILDCWRSSIGAKATMAVTGLLLFLFVVGHLIGNLALLGGPDKINAYAAFLHSPKMATPLVIVRIVMGVVAVLHVVTGIRLALLNRAARPVAYSRQSAVDATFASRYMVWTGLALLVFVIYHLLHFTVGMTNPEHSQLTTMLDGHEVKDVYGMVTASFGVPAIAVAYAAFMVVLFFHLSHGIQSMCQTVGINHPRYTPLIDKLSYVIAAALAGGNILLALSVLFGIVDEGVA